MRTPPKDKEGRPIPVPAIQVAPSTEYITQKREYELITPMFGGGVEPGIADPVTVVRATEIRGHLRFWWRATRGGTPAFNGQLELMKQAEDQLWGAASSEGKPSPSSVQLQVNTTFRGRRFVARNHRNEEVDVYALASPFGYVAFPLRDRRQPVMEGIKFTLTIRYPRNESAEVEAALWAWETFGGIGGRTRRGFGALKLIAVDNQQQSLPLATQLRVHLMRGIKTHIATGTLPADVPMLSSSEKSFVCTTTCRDAVEAWKYLITKLKDFRQQRNPGKQGNRPGRSRWPEPDAIRRLTNRKAPVHQQRITSTDIFPRAEFGLPIVFKFKDDLQGDPNVTTLEGAVEGEKRLASPLILRPLACANNQAVPSQVRDELAPNCDVQFNHPGQCALADDHVIEHNTLRHRFSVPVDICGEH